MPDNPWRELVGRRALVRNVKQPAGSNPIEVIVVEVAPSGEFVLFFLPTTNLKVWETAVDNLLVETLPNHITK